MYFRKDHFPPWVLLGNLSILNLYRQSNVTVAQVGTGSPYVYTTTFDSNSTKAELGFPDDASTTKFACVHSVGFISSTPYPYSSSTSSFEIVDPVAIVSSSDSSDSSDSTGDESFASTLRLGLAATGIALAGALF